MYFTKETVRKAVHDLRGNADHMLKIWFVLKAMGLKKGNGVQIDTGNSTPYLQMLFHSGAADHSFFVPFAHTERFAAMKHDAARSIIQTNIQRWASSGSVVTVDPTGYLSFENIDGNLTVFTGRQYPSGLGYGKAGFARDDNQRVTIPIVQFCVWLYAQENITGTTEEQLIAKMREDLSIDDAECSLIFVQKPFQIQYQEKPISNSELNSICQHAFDEAPDVEIISETSSEYIRRVRNMATISSDPSWVHEEPKSQLQRLIQQGEKAILLYGPPRTGKTRAIDQLIARNSPTRETIQLHEGWGYENLIIGLFPSKTQGQYEWRDGLLTSAIRRGKKVIVLEEMNRTRISQALGEVFSLLETSYRGEDHAIILPDGSSLFIPKDTLLIFTMNTVDTSTEDIDDALIGRMASVYFPPRIEDLNSILVAQGIPDNERDNIKTVFNAILANYPLGHGYFASLNRQYPFSAYYLAKIRPVLTNHFASFKPEIVSQIDNIVDSFFGAGA